MHLPQGFSNQGGVDNRVCRLRESLYGFKQSFRQWNLKLTNALIQNGYKLDYSLFTKWFINSCVVSIYMWMTCLF